MILRLNHRLRILLCAALAIGWLTWFSARDVSAYSYYLVETWPVAWDGSSNVRLLSPSTFPPNSDADILVRSAMGEWNLAPSTAFNFSYVRMDQDYPIDHFDGYSDTTAVPYWQLDPGVLGVTYLVNDGPFWFDADIVFSDLPVGVGYNFEPFPTCDVLAEPAPDNGYSFLLIALHELGHGAGLAHEPTGNESPNSSWFPVTMNPRYPSGGTLGQQNIIELHADDQNGIRFLYPHTGQSMPPQTDLAGAMFVSSSIVGKAIPASFEPASAAPGEEVFLSSVIENLGTTNQFFVNQGFYLSADPEITVADTLLGALQWDLGFGQALQFEVAAPMPEDLPAGIYYLGSILDDLEEVPEMFEDNNAVSYCTALTIERLGPEVLPITQQRATCGQTYRGPRPSVTHPLNMAPITWSLVNPEQGMTIRSGTGEITWPSPIPSQFLYIIMLRATNSSGSNTQTIYLGVDRLQPAIAPMSNATIACGKPFVGAAPVLTSPTCMQPILLWSLTSGPTGMSVNPDTGAASWPVPVPSSSPYPVEIRAVNSAGHGSVSRALTVLAGDMNGDADVTRQDLDAATTCVTGPAVMASTGCRCADADGDGDVDLRDAQALQATFGR